MDSTGNAWCSFLEEYDGGDQWEYCDHVCTACKGPPVTIDKGLPCVFPFIYDHIVHVSCAPYAHDVGFWCATSLEPGTRKAADWGDCACLGGILDKEENNIDSCMNAEDDCMKVHFYLHGLSMDFMPTAIFGASNSLVKVINVLMSEHADHAEFDSAGSNLTVLEASFNESSARFFHGDRDQQYNRRAG